MAPPDLVIRESILGGMKKIDTSDSGVLHSSDFRTIIDELGYNYGHSAVQKILINCKLDTLGNINYKKFATSLEEERKIHNEEQLRMAEARNAVTAKNSSRATAEAPWRADKFHQDKAAAERQSKLVQANRTLIMNLYKQLAHHLVKTDEVLNSLTELGIFPTREFKRILQKMESSEVGFSEFSRSLNIDTTLITDLSDSVSAGGIADKGKSHTRAKRYNAAATRSQLADSVPDDRLELHSIRKMFHRRPQETEGFGTEPHRNFGSTSVKDALASEKDPYSLLSHSQHEMVNGIQKVGQDGKHADFQLSFNSEEKLQRQQIIAALRCLDSGAMSLNDFRDKLFSMGFNIPPNIDSALKTSVDAGEMDIKKFTSLIDNYVFKSNVLENRIENLQIAEAVTKKFKEIFKESSKGNLSAAANALNMFQSMDTNGDGTLTMSEFVSGLQNLPTFTQGDITKEEARILFNSFDHRGDGKLEWNEFLNAIGAKMNAKRSHVVGVSFQKLDRFNKGSLPLDVIVEQYNVHVQPEVVNGNISAREGVHQLCQWFLDNAKDSTCITEQCFRDYYNTISLCIESDDDFLSMVNDSWAILGGSLPPPQLVGSKNSFLPVPPAKQCHGDVIGWGQEESVLEKGVKNDLSKKINPQYQSKNTNVINWKNYQEQGKDQSGTPEESFLSDFKAAGGVTRSGTRNYTSKNTSSLLYWQVSKQKESTPVHPLEDPNEDRLQSISFGTGTNNLPYQNEYPAAGQSVARTTSNRDHYVTGLSKKNLSSTIYTPAPFGVEGNHISMPKPGKKGIYSAAINKFNHDQNEVPQDESKELGSKLGSIPLSNLVSVDKVKKSGPKSLLETLNGQ